LGGNPRLELETALLRFIMTSEDPALDALSTRIAVLEERLGTTPAAAAPQVAAPASRAPEPPRADAPKRRSDVSLQKVRAAWQSIRGKVEGERQSLSAPLSRAAIDSVESNAVVLKLPNTWSAETLRDHSALIEKAIADVLGVPLKLRLKVDGSAPRGAAAQEESTDALFDYANERIR
jgi:hypothetical protein